MEDGPSGLTGPHVQWPVVAGLRPRRGHVLILLLLMEASSVKERMSRRGNVKQTVQRVIIFYGLQFIRNHKTLICRMSMWSKKREGTFFSIVCMRCMI